MKTTGSERALVVNMLRAAIIGAFFLAWEIGARTGFLDTFFFSSPTKIARDIFMLFAKGKIYPHLLMTMEEVFAGIFLGSLTGIVSAVIFGRNRMISRVFNPIIMGLYAVPKIAIAPLFVLWFGLGITSKIVFAWVVVSFLIFFNTYAGMQNVSKDLLDAVKAMGANKWQILAKVFLPNCLPWIFTGLRASLGAALIAAVVGEFVAADTGLGFLIMEGMNLFMTQRVLSIVLLLSVIVILMDLILRLLEKRFLRWQPNNVK